MKLKIWLFFALLDLFLLSGETSAEQIAVNSVTETMEIMTYPMQRFDNNGQICALVKIISPSPQAVFEGNVIGDTEYKTGEYWVYLSPGSKYLKIKHPYAEPLLVDFTSYLGEGLNSKTIYELSVSFPMKPVVIQIEADDSIRSLKQMEQIASNLAVTNPLYVHSRQANLYPFLDKSGKWGFMNSSFNVVIPPVYEEYSNSNSSIKGKYNWHNFKVLEENLKWEQDFYWVKKDGLWGCIDKKGKTIIPFMYVDLYEPPEDYTRCRVCIVTDVNRNHFLINRMTGEIYAEIPSWRGHRNSSFFSRPQAWIHVPDSARHKDNFYDKITGQKTDLKIPKGYEFRNFLPFNHLNFYNSSKGEIVTDYRGNVVFEGLWDTPINLRDKHETQWLFSYKGIFDLETDSYIYEDNTGNAVMLDEKWVDIPWGIHHNYVNLKDRTLTTEKPPLIPNKVQPYWFDVILNGIYHDFETLENMDVFPVDEEKFMITTWNSTGDSRILLLDLYGNFVKIQNNSVSTGTLKYLDTQLLKESVLLSL